MIDNICKSNGIHLEWNFSGHSFSSITGEGLEFINNEEIIKSFSRTVWDHENRTGELSKELILFEKGNELVMCLDTKDVSFLPLGTSSYRLVIVGIVDQDIPEIIFETSGDVLVYE